ncbi:hypothetical protein [Cryptosporangium sp. NPDC051539]|uniref:hypothetical protein n=1 Tax=Cryptosporangium sp. NPDC051539 TaxID=3363962 RepID=UPI0037BC316B
MQSDVDTSDRPGDGARTTPPATPATRAPGAPGSTTPAGTGPSSTPGGSSSSTSGTTPPAGGTNPTFGTPSGSSSPTPNGTPTTPPAAGTDGGTAGLVPASRPSAGGGRSGLNDGAAAARPDVQALLDAEYAATVRERWFGVQSAFVDDPESAVREASVVLEDSIAAIGRGLEKLRRSVTDAAEAADGTEDLRVALLRHREVIGRLLQL